MTIYAGAPYMTADYALYLQLDGAAQALLANATRVVSPGTTEDASDDVQNSEENAR